MDSRDQATLRVLRWRFEELPERIGQGVLIGALCWLASANVAVVPWLVCATATATIDAMLSKQFYKQPADRRLALFTALSRLASATAFASVMIIFLARPSFVCVAGAVLVGCAICLNNAVMTRGAPSSAWTLVGPSSAMLLIMPIFAQEQGQALDLGRAALLFVGAAAYVAFIGRLAATLSREGDAQRALAEDLERQRDFVRAARNEADQGQSRWSLLFQRSPLPQICFDGSPLYMMLSGEPPEAGDAAAMLANTRLVEVNEAALLLFGAPAFQETIDRAHFTDSLIAGFAQSMAAVDADGVFPPFDGAVRRLDGQEVEVRVHVRAVPDQDRAWALCIATLVDMTEVRLAEQSQREATQAAEAANLAKSEFLATMSHEIRTPLNGVLGMAQAMMMDKLSVAQRDRLSVIEESGAALLTILNDILDLSKIEAGKLELEDANFDLETVVQSAISPFQALADNKGLRLERRVGVDAAGAYRGDAVRLRQILHNLVSNAVKFTDKGQVVLTVSTIPEGVRFEVADTGMGIAADRIPKLFEKFVQADSSTTRKFGGTGLGLAICRELALAMGGDVRAYSELGSGSWFVADLPLRHGAGAAGKSKRVKTHAAPSEHRQLRVLAAEDNRVNQLVLRTLLAQRNVDPVIVDNGALALEAWETGEWDVILMDVQMPEMDGPTAALAIRAREAETGRTPTPIIALTANAMSHQTDSYRGAGMDGVIAKPIEIARLFQLIDEVSAARSRDAASVRGAA